MAEMPSVEVLTAFAAARSGTQKKVTGLTYAELLEGMRADPDEAAVRFRALLRDARPGVRQWACSAGGEVCGRRFVPTLLDAFNDRNALVQEMAMWALLEIEPTGQLLRPLLIGLRRCLLKWEDDAAFAVARLLALLDDADSAPYLARYLERSDVDKWDRMRVEEYLQHLKEGINPTLEQIRTHASHEQMARLCLLAFEVGSPDTEPALEQLLATAPDERCRAIASQTLDALKVARTGGPGPYLLGGHPKFDNLPKLRES